MTVDFQEQKEALDVFRSFLTVIIDDIFKLDVCSFQAKDFLEDFAQNDLKSDKLKVNRLVIAPHDKFIVLT